MTITIKAIPDTEQWHPEDMYTYGYRLKKGFEGNPVFTVKYNTSSVKEALHAFHLTYPIKCLDSWDIRAYQQKEVFEEYEETKNILYSDPLASLKDTPENSVEPRGQILKKGFDQINGIKVDEYGHPEDCFISISNRWEHYLRSKNKLKDNISITHRDVMFMMAELKMEREIHKHKEDNLADCAGYLGLYDDTFEEK